MFSKIMVPVDLAHLDRQSRALACATDLAALYNAAIEYVGVTTATPGAIAHTPAEFEQKLRQFADDQATQGGLATSARMIVAHDPTADMDAVLLRAVEETGADLVIMASHDPGIADYIWPSNGGKVAGHAHVSVMVIRG